MSWSPKVLGVRLLQILIHLPRMVHSAQANVQTTRQWVWVKQTHIPPPNLVIHTNNETCWYKKYYLSLGCFSDSLGIAPRKCHQDKSNLSIFILPPALPTQLLSSSCCSHTAPSLSLPSEWHWNKQGSHWCGQLSGQPPHAAGILWITQSRFLFP